MSCESSCGAKPKMNVRAETYKHIGLVRKCINRLVKALLDRAEDHDSTKLEDPEQKKFEELTPKLHGVTYDSTEYKMLLRQLGPALKHHYKHNRHHPQYFKSGVKSMTLVDLVEMLCDWKAATQRHKAGSIYKSIEQNQKRFGFSDEVKSILDNTIDAYFFQERME